MANIKHFNVPKEYEIPMEFYFIRPYGGEVTYKQKLYKKHRTRELFRGICKYANSHCALSIRQTFDGNYPDKKFVSLPNGGFLYAYHQEGDGTEDSLKKSAYNQALYKNVEDQIPIGIWYQIQSKKYLIYTGLPIAWVDGFFIIAIPSETGEIEDSLFKMSPCDLLRICTNHDMIN